MNISVAMCTYNGSQYLRDQLSSIIRQVRPPDEIIICDDGSRDNTLDILASFAHNAPFVVKIYCTETTLGTTKNFEKAISLCSGDVIVLSDQDDVWRTQKLSMIEKHFDLNLHDGGIFTNADVVDQYLQSLGFSIWEVVLFSKKEQGLVQDGKALDVLLKHLIVTGATLAFRSDLKKILMPFPMCWMHDAWIALNISVFSNLSLIDDNMIQYRQHGNNQIGGLPKGTIYRINETLSMDRETYYAADLERYEVARNHFSTWLPANHEVMKKLSSKIDHLRARSRMPAWRILRIPFVLKECLKGSYHRYSVNWQVAIRDLLIPPPSV